MAVAVACSDGGEGCIGCGICSTLLLLPPATVGAATTVAARRGVSAKEVFEDGEVCHRSVDYLHEAVVGELGRDKVPMPELLLEQAMSRRPLFTSSWMSHTVQFTGKDIPSHEMTG